MNFNDASNVNAAVIVGHPAHILRIYRFIEIYKPIVYILTDGSGSAGESRCGHVTGVLNELGANTSRLNCRFTDAEMYRIVRNGDKGILSGLVDEIADDLVIHNIDMVVGDALEGFNPIHDLCRYMINTIVERPSDDRAYSVSNYDFLLDGPPDLDPGEYGDGVIRIEMESDEFTRKMRAVNEYPGIQLDIESAIQAYGEDAFRTETLRLVRKTDQYVGWNTDVPYYESYGSKMVGHGVYSEVITFKKHLLPIAKYLAEYSTAHVARV